MIPALILMVLLAAGALAWWGERWGGSVARWIALTGLGVGAAILTVPLLERRDGVSSVTPWYSRLDVPWIPRFGIDFHLALDGLSLVLVGLALFLGLIAVVASWREIDRRVGFFHFNLLWTVAGVVGVFTAFDLFLFFFFWEVMLVPMVLLIALWGHERRLFAALKFLIFTQASGLLMLAAIVALVVMHFVDTGIVSFDYFELQQQTLLNQEAALWIFAGFMAAFLVKLPALPFHTWLPDAHTEAPTAGSVLLAGILLKTGAYGVIRFAIPLFPQAATAAAPVALAVGAIGVIYGAWLAFAQTDIKRLVAYTSVSHMGFVLLGAFAGGAVALQGTLVQMVAHGITTGALFVLVGALQERTHTREMSALGGIGAHAPRMTAIALFFAVASLGLPGTGNFIGEFLVLLGTFSVSVTWTAAAAVGLVLAAVYALVLVQRIFHGPPGAIVVDDFTAREVAMMAVLMLAILWLGLYPQTLLDAVAPALAGLQRAEGVAVVAVR